MLCISVLVSVSELHVFLNLILCIVSCLTYLMFPFRNIDLNVCLSQEEQYMVIQSDIFNQRKLLEGFDAFSNLWQHEALGCQSNLFSTSTTKITLNLQENKPTWLLWWLIRAFRLMFWIALLHTNFSPPFKTFCV